MSNTPSIRLDALAISAIYPGLNVGKKKKAYNKVFTVEQKKLAVRYASNNSYTCAAEKYHVTEQTIRNWKNLYPEHYKRN